MDACLMLTRSNPRQKTSLVDCSARSSSLTSSSLDSVSTSLVSSSSSFGELWQIPFRNVWLPRWPLMPKLSAFDLRGYFQIGQALMSGRFIEVERVHMHSLEICARKDYHGYMYIRSYHIYCVNGNWIHIKHIFHSYTFYRPYKDSCFFEHQIISQQKVTYIFALVRSFSIYYAVKTFWCVYAIVENRKTLFSDFYDHGIK
jgi:hypothetical protein